MQLLRSNGLISFLCVAVGGLVGAVKLQANPLQQTVTLLTKLQGSIVKAGEAEQAAYVLYYNWCDSTAKQKAFEIQNGKSDKEKLVAAISKASSGIEDSVAKIEDLTAQVASGEAKSKEAAAMRKSEQGVFEAAEKELMEVIETLGKAVEQLEQAQGGKSSLIQTSANTTDVENVLVGLASVIDSGSIANEDKAQLASLLQNTMEGADADQDQADPDKVYDNEKSNSITQVLMDMRDKSESNLHKTREEETERRRNFELAKQSLADESAAAAKELSEEKSSKAANEEAKGKAEGDLAMTKKALASSTEVLKVTQQDCVTKAADHEKGIRSRTEELDHLASAKKTVQDTMAGAAAQTYDFLQFSSTASQEMRARRKLVGKEITSLVKRLATEANSQELFQLASRISAVVRLGGPEPFAKIKIMVQQLIAKLEKEKASEMSEKEYCDQETAKTKAKQEDLEDTGEGLRAKIDQAASTSAKLKEQLQDLQVELKEQAVEGKQMNDARTAENEAYESAKVDLQQGLNGIRTAIRILKDYYASNEDSGESLIQEDTSGESLRDEMRQPEAPKKFEKATSGGEGIIGLLEVCESDIAKSLAETETDEAAAQSQHDKTVQMNKVTRVEKLKDGEYKTQQSKALDVAISEHSQDAATATAELQAVNEYEAKVKERCDKKPESFTEKKEKREAEIRGLQSALEALDGGQALLQRGRA